MFQAGSFDHIFERKKSIKREIEQTKFAIKNLNEFTFEAQYQPLSNKLHQLKLKLEELHLAGGDFEIKDISRVPKVLEITEEGQFIISKVLYSTEDTIPQDTSNFSFFRIGEAKEDDVNRLKFAAGQKVFVLRIAETSLFVENISKVRRITMDDRVYITIDWVGAEVQQTFFETPDMEELEEVISLLVKKFNFSKIRQIKKLQGLWNDRGTTYNTENEEHEKLLIHFWNLVFPDRRLEERITKQWSALGFQGRNPATDFRGAGILSLKFLVYMATNYTEEVRNILRKNSEYPFASAGINVTMIITTDFLLLREQKMNLPFVSPEWNCPLLTFLCYCDMEIAIEEFFCRFMFVLDAIWTHMKAGYMQFPEVMARCKTQMQYLLSKRPLSISQLAAWSQQSILMLDM